MNKMDALLVGIGQETGNNGHNLEFENRHAQHNGSNRTILA
jgi:hypothetical protein